MKIKKNNGDLQVFTPNKILSRIKNTAKGLKVDADLLFQKVIPNIQDGMTTTQIDEILAHQSADLLLRHPDYGLFGGRILISRQAKLIGDTCNDYDFSYDFFAAKTFLEKYSTKDEYGKPNELPHNMVRRVADYLGKDKEEADLFYEASLSRITSDSTPIYTNAGTVRKSLISCNLLENIGDDTDGILKTIDNASLASRAGSGIGLFGSNIRSEDSMVSSFSGKAGGIVRYADMVQSHLRFFKQGTRSGSAAIYFDIWHKDIIKFIELTLPIGDEKLRTRDLFTAVINCDLFMNKFLNKETWHLFCPEQINKAGLRPLQDLWGDEFEKEYNLAVELGLGTEIDPKIIVDAILKSQVESGKPYMFHKDNANRRNMQDNIGVIKQSNLCVAPYTQILTKDGYKVISSLKNQYIHVWNGEEWSGVKIEQTGTNQDFLRVTLVSGNTLDCTYYHKWYNSDGEVIRAMDLLPGTKLIDFKLPEQGDRVYFGEEVAKVEKLEEKLDSYCFTENIRGMGMFNGILTGNCVEITTVSKANYTSQCTLSAVNLEACETLEDIIKATKVLVRKLNRVIDKNTWADEASELAGLDQRALAIGVAGLADYFFKRGISFESNEAKTETELIFKTMYQSAIEESMKMSEEEGRTYPAWKGSRYEKGETYIEDWKPTNGQPIKLLNSLLLAQQPTASSAILLGVFESFQPIDANMFVRSVGQGEFSVVNKYLVRDLEKIGLWNEDIKRKIVAREGSVQSIEEIPDNLKAIYKTVWEIPQKTLMDLSAIRNKYTDQSQSLNLYFADAKYGKLLSALVYGWKIGLKTGSYYTRTKSKLETSNKLAGVTDFSCFGCSS